MGIELVFHSLQEIFPQVDVRILKAVAIEHQTDVDAAAEIIILEILPSLAAGLNHPKAVSESPTAIREYSSSLISEDGIRTFCQTPRKNCLKTVASLDISSIAHECFSDSDNRMESDNDTSAVMNSIPLCVSTSSIREESCSDQGSIKTLTQEMCSVIKNQTAPSGGSMPDSYTTVISTVEGDAIQHEHAYDVWPSQIKDSQSMEFGDVSTVYQSCENKVLESSKLSLLSDVVLASTDEGAMVERDNKHYVSEFKELEASGLPLDSPGKTISDNEIFNHNGWQLAFKDSSFGQTITMHLLEDLIDRAKEDKKSLLLTMESVVSLGKEVEQLENDIEVAKEEASRRDVVTLSRMKELNNRLKLVCEGNNKQAGEVNGERSILVTEARELQSRLSKISDESNKYLLVIEEIQKSLKTRLALAQAEREAVELHKKEKEEAACKSLSEQQCLMDRLLAETIKIEQQAEENTRLREFLIEKGCLVDTLQGEISLICEDVKLLNEMINNGMSLNQLMISCNKTCKLASSTSSCNTQTLDQFIWDDED